MKKFVNRNYFWSNVFVHQLIKLGVKHVCISPGSRNTPLTFAFANNNHIKKTVHVDERSSAFFALGVAKKTKNSVAIVTTSGTAVVELYPAIVEAFNQRVPLIICTADRPNWLINTGANQTINQNNIFNNHIRAFADVGLPQLTKSKLRTFVKTINKLIQIGSKIDPGPIHINFPFTKPLEPNTYTEETSLSIDEFLISSGLKERFSNANIPKEFLNTILTVKKPIIYCGWNENESIYKNSLLKFSKKFHIPIIADGTSTLRFCKGVISTHNCFLPFLKNQSDVIVQFGNAPTSQVMLKFFEEFKSKRYLINKFGDIKDPSRTKGKLINIEPTKFLEMVSEVIENNDEWNKWDTTLHEYDKECSKYKNRLLGKSLQIEPNVINNIVENLPKQSNIFISNSMPIRDFDLFSENAGQDFNIFVNRGASGIDGIISTASGIAFTSKKPTVLITGDLAFYHNISSLSTIVELNIPLVIVLLNNNGGGIFNMLPVAAETKTFRKYFITSHNLNFKKIVSAFSIEHYSIKRKNELERVLKICIKEKKYSVIEIKTDVKKSIEIRKKYLTECKEKFNEVVG